MTHKNIQLFPVRGRECAIRFGFTATSDSTALVEAPAYQPRTSCILAIPQKKTHSRCLLMKAQGCAFYSQVLLLRE